jgi:hypothetical protein
MTTKDRDPLELISEVDRIADEAARARLYRACDRVSKGQGTITDLLTMVPWKFQEILTTCQMLLPTMLAMASSTSCEWFTPAQRAWSVLWLPPGETPPDLVAEALEMYGPEARYGRRGWAVALLLGDDYGMTVRRTNFRGQHLEDGISDRVLATAASAVVRPDDFKDEDDEARTIFDLAGSRYLRLLGVDWTEEERAVVERSSPWAVMATSRLEWAIIEELYQIGTADVMDREPVWLGEDARARYLGQIRSEVVKDITPDRPTPYLVLEVVARRARLCVTRKLNDAR